MSQWPLTVLQNFPPKKGLFHILDRTPPATNMGNYYSFYSIFLNDRLFIIDKTYTHYIYAEVRSFLAYAPGEQFSLK